MDTFIFPGTVYYIVTGPAVRILRLLTMPLGVSQSVVTQIHIRLLFSQGARASIGHWNGRAENQHARQSGGLVVT